MPTDISLPEISKFLSVVPLNALIRVIFPESGDDASKIFLPLGKYLTNSNCLKSNFHDTNEPSSSSSHSSLPLG